MESYSIQISLPEDRNQAGTLSLVNSGGTVVAGPYTALGRSANNLATRHNNPTRNPLQPFGDTPLGGWSISGVVSTGRGTRFRERSFGPNGGIVLTPLSGDALSAYQNGRTGIMIHGGAPGRTGGLRPTAGCIRLSNSDMQNFLMVASLFTAISGIINGADGRLGLPVEMANVDIEDADEDLQDPPPNGNPAPIGQPPSGDQMINDALRQELQRALQERNGEVGNELRERLRQLEQGRINDRFAIREQQRQQHEDAHFQRQFERQERERDRARQQEREREQQQREQEQAQQEREREQDQARQQEQRERDRQQAQVERVAEQAERRQEQRMQEQQAREARAQQEQQEREQREQREQQQREREQRERDQRERDQAQRERAEREREARARQERQAQEQREREQRERDRQQISLARHFADQLQFGDELRRLEQQINLGFPRNEGLSLPDVRDLFSTDIMEELLKDDSPSLEEMIVKRRAIMSNILEK